MWLKINGFWRYVAICEKNFYTKKDAKMQFSQFHKAVLILSNNLKVDDLLILSYEHNNMLFQIKYIRI